MGLVATAFQERVETIKMGSTVIDKDVIECEADANHAGDAPPK